MSSSPKKDFQRLPTHVLPINYDITLKPDLVKFTFEGSEKIQVHVHDKTDRITLNVNEVKISENNLSVFYPHDHKNIEIKEIEYNNEKEIAILKFKDSLRPGDAVLSLSFTGILNDKMLGFYRSKYVGPDGVEKYSAVTQFEATSARNAFPCWDEPAHKATFDINLIVPNDPKVKALSNMPVLNETVSGDQRIVAFSKSPIMSTYLVAFVVGEYDYIETRSRDGVLVRVYTPYGKTEQGRYALDVCARSLDFYKDYFQIPYPLNKMDMIAIADFACGAMENWGLVTYRETCILVDPKNTATVRKQNIAITVAHELAHQWFGNLVTMEWWTHLWLNEGFATFMEYLCVNELFPSYNIWSQFVSDVLIEALNLDGLDNSHPIEIPVQNPAEIDEIFDSISYSKGASVIRMLHSYISDETFRSGMNMYLSKFSYKNAMTEDLWASLEEASKKPIRRVMTTWTKQKGYPVITVNTKFDSATNTMTLILHQEKFNLNGKLSDADKSSIWLVPISVITSTSNGKPVIETLMEAREMKLTFNLGPKDWFKLNPSTVGTYRVCYSPETFTNFLPNIENKSLLPLDRFGLLNDTYALVLAGKQSSANLFRLISSFHDEDNYTVWCTISSIFVKFNQLLGGTPFHAKFQEFGRNLINAKIFPKITWQSKSDESHLNTLLRSLLISRLVSFEDASSIEECKRLFDDHIKNSTTIPADLRSAVYRGVAINCNNEIYDTMLKLFKQADLQEEKNRIICSLAFAKDPTFINRILEFSLTDNIRSQDTVFVIGSIANNICGRELAWEFFKKNVDIFAKRYERGFLLSHLVKMVTENFNSEQKATEIEQFFSKHTLPGVERSLQQGLETVRLNHAICTRDQESLKSFFNLN